MASTSAVNSTPPPTPGVKAPITLPTPSTSSFPPSASSPPPASWATMPHKSQLAILFLSRVADFFQMACLQATMFHHLRSLSPSAGGPTISYQVGVFTGVFTSAQILTALVWGRVADYPSYGRKRVLLIGLVGTGMSCIGIAFARTYQQAVGWRVVGGAVNGTVGAARTMLAERIEKRWHSRAFLVLPLAFNVANIFGPIMGGLLADPVKHYPRLFGEGSTFGGTNGVGWMKRFPYAAPNLMSAAVLFTEAAIVYLGLVETLEGRKFMRDRGLELGDSLRHVLAGMLGKENGYTQLPYQNEPQDDIEVSAPAKENVAASRTAATLPFAQIWTRNVIFTLISLAIFDFHLGAFTSLFLTFLSNRRSTDAISLPFHFNGGLGFDSYTVGLAMSILGMLGIALQLFLYPRINARLGLLRAFRVFLYGFPLAYFITPYLVLLPSSPAPAPASGFLLWLGIAVVLLVHTTARTFALPAAILLLNNCTPHPSVLATVHGLGQSTSSLFRTVGPIVAGRWYGLGLENGAVGTAWWAVAAISVAGCAVSWYVYNGSGHEVLLPGEVRKGERVVKGRE